MSVNIGHAVQDEDGGITGYLIGDQTGKEIRIQSWYDRKDGWGVYLECNDRELARKAAEYMAAICEDDSYGYSQRDRWSGYNSIMKNGGRVSGGTGSFDCSSLCISCYILAGLGHKASGYTGDMERSLLATGRFTAYKDARRLHEGEYALRGGLYIKAGKHVCMVLEDGKYDVNSGELPNANAPDVDEAAIGRKAYPIRGTVNVRATPVSGKVVGYLRKGKCAAIEEVDIDTGWYCVTAPNGKAGFVTNNSKYVEVR